MNPSDSPVLRKARGAFFTPSELSRFVADWAIRSADDTVLEPSCGEAAFLLPAADRLRRLGAHVDLRKQLHGVEIHTASAIAASASLAVEGFGSTVSVGDFFDQPIPQDKYAAVIGNPPYIRYQQFSGQVRTKSLEIALAQGVRLTGLASSWAAFTVHSSTFLEPDGRLGLVLPAELLTVNYAAQVRRFLLKRFAKVRIVLFEERVFPGVSEEVLLLLAEGSGGADSFELYQARNLADLERMCADRWTDFAPLGDDKWTSALLPSDALASYSAATGGAEFSNLIDWGDTYLGAVTGMNKFFSLTRADAVALGLREDEVRRISPPGSKHLRGLRFAEASWSDLATHGSNCLLFAPGDNPSSAARAYISQGEAAGANQGYKCRNRSPWWRVPLVETPDLLFTYMNHERPRLISNEAGVDILNSVYGVRLKEQNRDLGRELLPLGCLNSLTLLGGEMVGRAFGGGMLKHEPKEANLLPVPSLTLLTASADALRGIRPQVGRALRAGKLQRAVELVDNIILVRNGGLSVNQITGLRSARELLFERRVSRSRGQRVDDR